jgi:hypothetical protein
MAFCSKCGNDIGEKKFCTNCGAQSVEQVPKPKITIPVAETPDVVAETSANQPPETSLQTRKRLLYFIGAGVAVVLGLVIVGAATARHWEKTDVPAKAETFRSEVYLTGNYDVFDTGVNPCWIGEDWTSCTNTYIDEYNYACIGVPLTPASYDYCARYLSMIQDMQARDTYYAYVSSLGSWGYLSQVPEQATRQVSNNDFRPAVTHSAVCIFGFLGECR